MQSGSKIVTFRTTVRGLEVEVLIDCQLVADVIAPRLNWPNRKSKAATAVSGAILVRHTTPPPPHLAELGDG
jgi:hypothetical protein